MSDLPDRLKDALPKAIRNLRPRRWPIVVMRLCLLAAGISCLLGVAGSYVRVTPDVLLLLVAPAILATAATMVFAVAVMVRPPIEIVRLGKTLEVCTDRSRYQVTDVIEIQFVSGPEEDYAETDLDLPIRDVRITVRGTLGIRQIKLTLSGADASRLSAWATEKGIRVIGADHFAL